MKILRVRDTAAKVGLNDRDIRRLESAGLFPKRFTICPTGRGRAVGHLESEVDQWIADRLAARDAD